MIRFINLKNQICEGQNHFAFYDTVSDILLSFYDDEIFTTLEQFVDSYNQSYLYQDQTSRPLKRFTDLIPDNYFDKENTNYENSTLRTQL